MTPDGKILVVVAGLSKQPGKGKMARLIAEAIEKQQDMRLSCIGLSEENDHLTVGSGLVRLLPIEQHETALKEAKEGGVDVVVDFTLATSPNEILPIPALCCKIGAPFISGVTGGNEAKLAEVTVKSDTYGVFANNFSAEVNIATEMLKFAAENFSGALRGFRRFLKESHQGPDPKRPDFKSKKDPSGTMKKMLPLISKLVDEPVDVSEIVMVRDRRVQEFEEGISGEFLDGHGKHKYAFQSPDGTVELVIEHNVKGRMTYVNGVMRAIRWVATHPNNRGRLFSFMDVLKG